MQEHRPERTRGTCFTYATLVLLLLNLSLATSANGATKASPTISTTLSSSSVAVGAQVYDTASLSGGNGPTGRIVYTDYQTADCSGQGDEIGNVTVTGNSNALPSYDVTFSSPGSYSFQAVYTGDSNNNPATSACELLTVVAASSTVTSTTPEFPNSPLLVLLASLFAAAALYGSSVATRKRRSA